MNIGNNTIENLNKQEEDIRKLDLWEKVWNIQAEVKSLIKDELNKFQNYKYFDEAQILTILKPLLVKYRVSLMISDDDTQPLQHEREGSNHFIKYLKIMILGNLDNKKEAQEFKFWACGSNTDFAKAKGSAETYAMKYILSKFFLIKVLDENDPELKAERVENKVKDSTIDKGKTVDTSWK